MHALEGLLRADCQHVRLQSVSWRCHRRGSGRHIAKHELRLTMVASVLGRPVERGSVSCASLCGALLVSLQSSGSRVGEPKRWVTIGLARRRPRRRCHPCRSEGLALRCGRLIGIALRRCRARSRCAANPGLSVRRCSPYRGPAGRRCSGHSTTGRCRAPSRS